MLHFAGGWWEAESFVELTGSIAVESGNMRYIQPQDNGLFTLGESHEIGKLSDYPFHLALFGEVANLASYPIVLVEYYFASNSPNNLQAHDL